jgi:hypothetical protein
MGYSSKKQFSPLSDEIGQVIDGCGNSYEKKYYVNGTYIDLCGLSVEAYMTNPCCGGSNEGGSSQPSKTKNKIIITATVDEETGVVYYQATSSYPVASNLKISVKSNTGAITVLDMFVGDTESKAEIGDSADIMTAIFNIDEDDNYTYIAAIEGIVMDYTVYVGAPLKSYLNILNGDKIKAFDSASMSLDTTIDIEFTVPATDVNYNIMNDADFDEFCKENQHAFVIALPTELYDRDSYLIVNYGNDDVKGKFVREGKVTIDNTSYTVIAEYGTDDIMPYVPLYGEENKFIYKFSLIK